MKNIISYQLLFVALKILFLAQVIANLNDIIVIIYRVTKTNGTCYTRALFRTRDLFRTKRKIIHQVNIKDDKL